MSEARPIVAINGSFLTQPLSGVQRYAREMCRALGARDARPFRTLLVSPPGGAADPELRLLADAVVVDTVRAPAAPWVQLRLPFLCRKHGGELLWSPGGAGPLGVQRQICSIHDGSVFRDDPWFSAAFRTYYRWLLPRLARRSAAVATLSEFSREELEGHLGVTRSRICVIPCGISKSFARCETSPKYRQYAPYVLAFGGDNPRKDTLTSLRAWGALPESLRRSHHLLVFGMAAKVHRRQRLPESLDRVRFLDFVPEPELAGLYSGARALLYPSLYEGFGMPPLEALACGVPVVVSSTGSLPEVCGAAALYAEPRDAEAFASQLVRLLCDEGLRQALLSAAEERLHSYRWSRSAALLEALILRQLPGAGAC